MESERLFNQLNRAHDKAKSKDKHQPKIRFACAPRQAREMSNRIPLNGNGHRSVEELLEAQSVTPSDKQKKWYHSFVTSPTIWILSELKISAPELRVLICVVHAAGQDKSGLLLCSKTQAEMVRITGLGRTTIYRSLKRLCELDILADVSMGYHRPQFMVNQLSEWQPAAWKPDSKVYRSILAAGVEND